MSPVNSPIDLPVWWRGSELLAICHAGAAVLLLAAVLARYARGRRQQAEVEDGHDIEEGLQVGSGGMAEGVQQANSGNFFRSPPGLCHPSQVDGPQPGLLTLEQVSLYRHALAAAAFGVPGDMQQEDDTLPPGLCLPNQVECQPVSPLQVGSGVAQGVQQANSGNFFRSPPGLCHPSQVDSPQPGLPTLEQVALHRRALALGGFSVPQDVRQVTDNLHLPPGLCLPSQVESQPPSPQVGSGSMAQGVQQANSGSLRSPPGLCRPNQVDSSQPALPTLEQEWQPTSPVWRRPNEPTSPIRLWREQAWHFEDREGRLENDGQTFQARDLWDWKNPVTSYALEIRNFKKVIEKIKEGGEGMSMASSYASGASSPASSTASS
ncbi:unnamed protein product [Symbiodinium natans]|uniref:Uncharacterized protein n=1 Tax=Symbiodinium natans TaxID=878477 RepID=A0A812T9X0_9DINO|nr:unnamed protein product [Symbiodinium natans]